MSKIIPGEGPINAKLMIIGEAPGEEEVKAGRPFVGPSGNILTNALKQWGVHRDECYITNVVKIHPPGNKLWMLSIPIESFIPQLNEEINKINPNCILLVGATALKYVTGLEGINKWRGSILEVHGKYKGIPCLHPAQFLDPKKGSWKDEAIFRNFDVKRAIEESGNRNLNLPQRRLWVCRNSLELIRFLDRVHDRLSVDIETHRSFPLCIGLSTYPKEAMSVILTYPKKQPTRDQLYIWKQLIEFFGDRKHDIKIIGQNFKFDQYICDSVGINIPDPYSDTMLKAHTCYPELPKGLGFLTSIWTREPYYKDEGKEFDVHKHGIERLLLYNAKDAAITCEVDEVLDGQLKEVGTYDFYYDYVMKLHRFYRNIEDVGFLKDEERAESLKTKYWSMYEEKFNENRAIVGHGFNPNSNTQVPDVLFNELKIPKRQNTKEETLQSLFGNTIKDDRRRTVINNILDLRKIRKTLGTYICSRTDYDGRIRTNYNIVGTETGRSSTSILDPPNRVTKRGMPFQMITKHSRIGKDIREMMVADPGYVFIEVDKSQAEGRIVALLSKDYDLLKRYENNEDVHSYTAAPIFGVPIEQVISEHKAGDSKKRFLGKKTRHAGNYRMGKHRFMLACAEEEVMISEKEAALFLFKFHRANPKLRTVFWAEIEDQIQRNCQLINPFGRVRQFFGKLNEDTYKEGYATIPQSTVPDALRHETLRAIGRYQNSRMVDFNIVQEGHDSLLLLLPEREYMDYCKILKEEMERPIDFSRCSLKRGKLKIPCEFKIGTRWSDMEDLEVECQPMLIAGTQNIEA